MLPLSWSFYRVIRQLGDQGAAVILLSSDLLELIGLSDRILVVARGSIVDRVPAADATEERIISSAVTQVRNSRALHKEELTFVPSSQAASKKTLQILEVIWRRYAGALLLLAIVLLVSAYTSTQSRYFFTERNLGNLVIQIVPLGLVSIGQMIVILLGGIDLSVGPLMSLTTALASYAITNNSNGLVGIALCLSVGLLIGGLNSLLIVRPSPGGNVSDIFSDLVALRFGWFPAAGLVILAIGVIGEWLLLRGRIGIRLYAVGSRPETAFVAGLPVARIRWLAYLFSGLMATLAGLVIAARIGSGDPQAGSQFTLSSIAAVVVGGTSVFGGRGTMV